jgi:hypothetical protein
VVFFGVSLALATEVEKRSVCAFVRRVRGVLRTRLRGIHSFDSSVCPSPHPHHCLENSIIIILLLLTL